jgi:hypothetical protein
VGEESKSRVSTWDRGTSSAGGGGSKADQSARSDSRGILPLSFLGKVAVEWEAGRSIEFGIENLDDRRVLEYRAQCRRLSRVTQARFCTLPTIIQPAKRDRSYKAL